MHNKRQRREEITWEVEGGRRERPLDSWKKVVKRNITRRGLQEEDIWNRDGWKMM